MEKIFKILIIDDDQVDSLSIKRALKSTEINAETDWVDNALKGIQALESSAYDCVFIDLKLPDMNGIELTKLIRGKGILTPILVVTSFGDEKIAAEAMRSGASDYFPKSLITPEGLLLSIRNVMRTYEIDCIRRETEKALRESEARHRESQKIAKICHVEFDLISDETICSEEALIIFGIENTVEFSYKKFLTLIHPDDKIIFEKNIEQIIKSQKGFNIDFRIILNNETLKVINAKCQTEIEKPNKIMGIFQDVTDRKTIEKELITAKEIAEDSVNMRERFMANISHEIRTPMNGILGLSNILLDMERDPEKIEYLRAIKSSGDNLLVIINDLLDYSKIESGKLQFEKIPFNLRELIKSTCTMLEIKAKEKGIGLRYDVDERIPKLILGDTVRLNQIIVNLTGNAIKFTETGEVLIRIRLKEESYQKISLQFDIHDTGIGIPDNKLEYIFESFTQANIDTERKYGGTGLGLAISKQLVELQSGKIWVISNPGIGSTFSFVLGYEKIITQNGNGSGGSDLSKGSITNWNHIKILLVEDNKINQLLANKILKSWDLQVDIAENGFEAVEKSKLNKYDLILMDLQMPRMDGYNATKILRQELSFKNPIIAMTASAMKEELERCLSLGMSDYITKPFRPEELQKLLKKWLKTEESIVS